MAVQRELLTTVSYSAKYVLEYHAVQPAADGTLPEGSYVSTGHMERLAKAYHPFAHLITFDDGYRSVYDHAFPIFQPLGVPAVVSIVTEATRDSGSADASPDHMSQAELRELVDAGWAIAFHAGTVAEHELDYRRMSEILRDGVVIAPGKTPSQVALDDFRALSYLKAITWDAADQNLLSSLTADRAEVERLVATGMTADKATVEVLARKLRAGRERLALQCALGVEQVDTFIYPQSESNPLVWEASAKAGFVRGYAGGAIGDDSNPFNLKRTWMNDFTPIPQLDPATLKLFCPPGAVPDLQLGYCVDADNAYGPFTAAMTADCIRWGGGPACSYTREFIIDGHRVYVPRWNKAFAASLRGTGVCMKGAHKDTRFPGYCVEDATVSASKVKEVYGPFESRILANCARWGGGDPCFTNRWSYAFFESLQ